MKISERQLKSLIKRVISENKMEEMGACEMDNHGMDSYSSRSMPVEDHMHSEMCDDACSIQDICDAELREYCIACWCARNNCERQEFEDACSRGRR